MKQYPKISIVTPNFNQVHYLEETILSVLNQNYPNLEYIIMDGGSTDGSVEIIKKYADRLTYWETTPDEGMYHAIQKGFEKSTGEIMAWINSDDMYLSKSLFSVAEIFTVFPQVNWLLGYPVLYDETGRLVETSHSMRQWSKYDFYTGNYKWIQQESVFWKRSLWEKAGAKVDINLKYAGDFELWARFFELEKLYVTTALLSGFRMREGQLSLSQQKRYEEEIQSVLLSHIYTIEEKNVLQKYRRLLKMRSFLSRFKFINSKAMLEKFKLDTFGYPPVIRYNRFKNRFEI